MRIFEGFNQSTNCPICGTNKEGKAILLPDYTTERDGTCEATQVHLDCLDLAIAKNDPDNNVIYQYIKTKED